MSKIYFSLFWLFLAHAVEEYLTRFYEVDQIIATLSSNLLVSQQTIFFWVQALWLGLLMSIHHLSKRYEIPRWLLGIIGIVFIVELSHLVPAVLAWRYYPGLVTSLAIIAFGFFYWKTLLVGEQSHTIKPGGHHE